MSTVSKENIQQWATDRDFLSKWLPQWFSLSSFHLKKEKDYDLETV
jgi:hypothetical protein